MASPERKSEAARIVEKQREKQGDTRRHPHEERVVHDILAKWPTVHALMTYTGTSEEPEEPCSLVLFTTEHGLRGKLNDRERDISCWAAANTLEGLLNALEEALTGPSHVWTANRDRKSVV